MRMAEMGFGLGREEVMRVAFAIAHNPHPLERGLLEGSMQRSPTHFVVNSPTTELCKRTSVD